MGEGPARQSHNVWAFLVPALLVVELPLVGRLFLSELILLCLLPGLVASRARALRNRAPRLVLLGGLAWLAMQIYSDVVRATPFADYARGWSKIAFFLLNFTAIYLLLLDSSRRALLFAWGIVVGQLVSFIVAPSELATDIPWKFGMAPPVSLALVLLARDHTKLRVQSLVLLLFATGLNFVLGFRSMAAFCFVTAAFVLWQHGLSRVRGVTLLVAPIIAIVTVSKLYGCMASGGYLGEEAKDKYELQASGEFGLLLGARVELFASTQAIIDSPIVGHGSWAKDFKYVDLLNERLADFGYEITMDPENELVPSHSYFMGAWVESGVIGAAFWVYVLALVLLGMRASLVTRSGIEPVVVFVGASLVWAILFSPFGAEARITAAYGITLALAARHAAKGSNQGHGKAVNE